MRTSVLLNLAVAVGSAFAQDKCLVDPAWLGCVSTQVDAALTVCNSAATLPLSTAVSVLLSCDCKGFDINYSCAKTYCPGDTSLQSQFLNSYGRCTSFVSNPFAVPTTAGTVPISPITQTASTAVPSASNTLIPTSTTTSSASSSTSSTTGPTSAPGTTTSVATSQVSITTSASRAAANPVLALNGGLGGFLAFMAGTAAFM